MDALVLFAFILLGVIALWLLYGEGLIRKPWAAALCAILMALTLALRARVFDVETDDYRWFLSTWFQYYRNNGGFRAFGTLPPYCNYHVPYLYLLALLSYLPGKDLYLIKLLSVIFDLLLAWGSMKLLGRITQNKALRLALFFTILLVHNHILRITFPGTRPWLISPRKTEWHINTFISKHLFCRLF